MRRWGFFLAIACSLAWGTDALVSNFTFAMVSGSASGELWVLARGDASNGASLLSLAAESGSVQWSGSSSVLFPKDAVGVQDEVLSGVTGEHRRSLALRLGSAIFFQAYGENSSNSSIVPEGLLRIQDGESVVFPVAAAGLGPTEAANWSSPLQVTIGDGSWDKAGKLWLARGQWGICRSSVAPSSWKDTAIADTIPALLLDSALAEWDTIRSSVELDTTTHLPVWALVLDSSKGTMWIGSERGLWRGHRDSSELHLISLGKYDTLRITGIWCDSSGTRIFVESSQRSSATTSSTTQTHSTLWRSLDRGATFTQLGLPYDSLDLSISSVAFVGDIAWLAVQGIENSQSGLLKVSSSGPLTWDDSLRMDDREDASSWIWSLEAGVVDRDILVTGVFSFPLDSGLGLAVTTFGAGISVSADSGQTWKPILNQTSVKGNLKEIRMIPSVLSSGSTSLIAYRLSESAKITIEVFSYDMRKIRTIVRSVARSYDPIRSSDAKTDFWDGTDSRGNSVTMGMYYVRVRDNHGHEGWGKVMWLGGNS
ncbi:MAG TPA: hypothetical protein VLM37_11225 [Fibrobacteraceae bacterium]|nr:hypothetical protein [Fibrobacteraceae bacterium]